MQFLKAEAVEYEIKWNASKWRFGSQLNTNSHWEVRGFQRIWNTMTNAQPLTMDICIQIRYDIWFESHYGNQSRGYSIWGRPLWPPAVPRLAARSSQSNPRGSGPEVLKRERGHVTAETGVAEVGVFRALQPNAGGVIFLYIIDGDEIRELFTLIDHHILSNSQIPN